nr:hypothetical protein [uncultured Pseudomonas sp.]
MVSDKAAIDGMLAFALEERLWVELASGALVPAMIAMAEMLPKDAVVGLGRLWRKHIAAGHEPVGEPVATGLKPLSQARLLDGTGPQMIQPIRRPGKPHIRNQNNPALLQRGGQLYECLCFDSHRWLLVRITALRNS